LTLSFWIFAIDLRALTDGFSCNSGIKASF
jgi:hypothetical protein